MGGYQLVARLLAAAALWVRIQTSLKIQNGRHKQRSGQHTIVRQKKYKENIISWSDFQTTCSKLMALLQTQASSKVEQDYLIVVGGNPSKNIS